jgi:hypothetical protein
MIFVVVGTLLIVLNHIIRSAIRKSKGVYNVKENDKKVGLISTVVIALVAIGLIVAGALLMTSNQFVAEVTYNSFNVGLILLILGVSSFLCLGISIKKLLFALKSEKPVINE